MKEITINKKTIAKIDKIIKGRSIEEIRNSDKEKIGKLLLEEIAKKTGLTVTQIAKKHIAKIFNISENTANSRYKYIKTANLYLENKLDILLNSILGNTTEEKQEEKEVIKEIDQENKKDSVEDTNVIEDNTDTEEQNKTQEPIEEQEKEDNDNEATVDTKKEENNNFKENNDLLDTFKIFEVKKDTEEKEEKNINEEEVNEVIQEDNTLDQNKEEVISLEQATEDNREREIDNTETETNLETMQEQEQEQNLNQEQDDQDEMPERVIEDTQVQEQEKELKEKTEIEQPVGDSNSVQSQQVQETNQEINSTQDSNQPENTQYEENTQHEQVVDNEPVDNNTDTMNSVDNEPSSLTDVVDTPSQPEQQLQPNQQSTKDKVLLFLKDKKKLTSIIGGVLLVIAFAVIYFINNKAPSTTSTVNNTNNVSKVEVKENTNVANNTEATNTNSNSTADTQSNTQVVELEENKEKIKKMLDGVLQAFEKGGAQGDIVKYKGSIFIPSKIFFIYYASTKKTSKGVTALVNNIFKLDSDLNNINVVYIKFKPYVTDQFLQATCKANHANDMDCENLKALRKNKQLVEETQIMLNHKLGYFKDLGFVFFVDKNTYTIITNTEGIPMTINDFILKKITPLFDLLDAQEVAYLKGLLDNKEGIYNLDFNPIYNGQEKIFNVIKKISAKADKILKNPKTDDVQKEGALWLTYYMYLVYKAFSSNK